MTIPRRADYLAPGDPHPAAPPKLLAELPHVGEELAIAPIPASTRNRKSTHPAFAEDVDYDPVSATAPPRARIRYVDRSHIDDQWDHDEFERHEKRRNSNQPLVHRQRRSSCKSNAKSTLGEILSEAHQQATPFAGLIVTAALVAAAGLLIHMMAGSKSNPNVDDFALPGFRVEANEESLPPDHSAPLAEVTPTSESTETEGLNLKSGELGPVEIPTDKNSGSELSAQTAPPLDDASIKPSAPLGQLSFPLTETPLALDYSKATDPDLEVLPEVAERTEAGASEGINR